MPGYQERYKVQGDFRGTQGEAERLRLQKRVDELNMMEHKKNMGWKTPEDIRAMQYETQAKKQTDASLDDEIVMRAMYGGSREEINTQLKDPAQPITETESKFLKNPMTPAMIRERAKISLQNQGREGIERIRTTARNSANTKSKKEAVLTYLSGIDPQSGLSVPIGGGESKTYTGSELKDFVRRSIANKFPLEKLDSDPEIQTALARFDVAPEGPGMMERAASKIGGYMSRFTGGKKPAASSPTIPDVPEAPLPPEQSYPEAPTAPETPEEPYVAGDEDMDAEVLRQYPGAVKGDDGTWEIQQNGQTFTIKPQR